MYVSSEQKEEHDVHYDVAFEEVGPESVVYHWPDRERMINMFKARMMVQLLSV